MDNVDNPKTFWRACAFGLLGLWKSLGCAGDILGKTAFWRACARILAARRPGWTAASGRQCGTSPQKSDFGRPKSGYPHYPQKRFPPKVEKKAQQLPGFWRRAHKLSTRLSTDRSVPPGASAQPQNRPKRGEKVYPATLYHTLPAHANKRMGGGREGDGEGTVLSWSPRKYQRRLRCDVKGKLIKLEGGTAAPRGRENSACPDRRKRHPFP